MRRTLRPVLLSLVAGALAMAPLPRLEARDLTVPELAEIAKAIGCKDEPSDYVAGYFRSDDRLSGVFWCRAKLDEFDPEFLIVVVDRHARRLLACPDAMVSVNRPLGLRILRDRQVPLSWFVPPYASAGTGPDGPYARGPLIDTGDESIGEQWICHEGAWIVHVYH